MRSKAPFFGKIPHMVPTRLHGQEGSVLLESVQVRTLVVRRGALGPSTLVPVPEGTSALHAGLEHLKQTQGPDAVDDWFVIEE